ncbi:Ig-like domain-containing protein [Jinshanibacter sp. LJY008]|uniref:Ig-like domain-containing protein n=1 Tax=Limnobaculum eriocheiris TaxID=2897391 RepID=A0A9X1MVD7_9GAMM|nr:Ig-like domain-containing protein [Limnobaculum eriocheiris]MCD1124875.1 Ig-like domain-containing protein [Limnobaculum eriocheiris]
MNANASLLVNSGSGPSQIVSLNAGKPIKIKIQAGTKYLLKNQSDNFAPENVTLQRNGDDLYVILEGDTSPAIVIEDYYLSGDNTPLLGMAEDGQIYAYVVTDGSGLGDGYLFNDGSFAPVALGGMPMGDGAYLFENTETNDSGLLALWPWFLGAAVIGGIVGNAIYEHNKDNDSSPSPQPASVPTLSGATDVTGNITGPITYGSVTDETKPTIYGTGEAGNIITIYDNGIAIGSAVVGSDGNWSFSPETALSDGSHEITITQTNPDGQTSEQSNDFTFIVDSVAPNKPLFEVSDDVGAITGTIANGATTDDARPEITGKGEAGSTITIFIDGKEAGKTAVGEDGTWSWTPTADLADGHYQITVTETDIAGNTSATSPTFDFNVDVSAPDKPPRLEAYDDVGIRVGLIENGSKTDDARPEFKGWGEVGNIVIIYDNSDGSGEKELGRTTVNADGTWSWTPDFDLAQGNHSITYTQTDKAGGVSALSDSRDFVVDTTPPAKPGIGDIIDKTGDNTGSITDGGITDETKPEINGKGEPGSTITITDNGEVIGTVIVDEKGNWTFTPDEELGEGDHSLVITETDEAGNTSEPSDPIDFVVDTTPPAKPGIGDIIDKTGDKTGSITDGGSTDETKPEINGKGDPGSTITITDNGEVIGTVIVDEKGNWTFTPDEELGEGDHSLVITETDEAGNTSEPSDPIDFVVDTTPPAKPGIGDIIDKTGDKTGSITDGGITDETKPEINGKGEPGSTITITDNGEVIGTVIVDEKGNWTFTPDEELGEGDHSLVITETDEAGNTSEPSDPIDFVVDTTPPAKPGIGDIIDKTGDKTGSITDGGITDETKPEINGKGEPGSTITITDNGEVIGTVIVDEKGNWTFTPDEELGEGDHSLVITETDEAGNTSEPSDPIDFVVDTTPPAKPGIGDIIDKTGDKTGSITDGGITDETKPEINGKGEPGSTITITDNGEVIGTVIVDEKGNWTFTPDEELGEGDHSLVITETDEAGNTSEPSESIDFVVDTTPPAKPGIDSVIDNQGDITGSISNGSETDDTTPTFSGEGEPGNIITVIDGGKVIGTAIIDENGAWTFTPETPLEEGKHNITVTETDKAGNTSEPSDGFEFVVDTTAPDSANLSITGVLDNYGEITGNITNGGATDDSRPTIQGTGTAGDTIILYVNDGTGNHEIGRGIVDANGKWNIQPATPLLPGSNQFTVVEVDTAGNKTDPSNQYTVTLDVSRPSEPVIVNVLDNAGDIIGPLQKGDVTDDNKPAITGTAEAGYTIRIYDGVTLLGSTIADNKGVWTFTPNTALADGKHGITATATSPVGQTSDKTGIFDFEIDTKAPNAVENLVVTDNVGDYQGVLKNGDTSDDNTPTFSGKAEVGSTVTIYADGKVLGTAKVDNEGKWTFTPDSALADGDYKFTTTVTDKAGNVNPDGPSLSITIDTSNYSVSITTLIDDFGTITGNISANGVTDDTKPEIIGQGKPGATIKVYDGSTLLGETTVKANGNWSFTPSDALKDGTHSITVTMTDKAGNLTGPTAAFDFTVDTIAPAMPVIDSAIDDVGSKQSSLASGSITDDSTPTLKGSAEKGSVVTVYDGNVMLGTVIADSSTGAWNFTPATPISEGEHKFHVTATDAAGNTSKPSADFIIITDYTRPDSSKLSITGVDDQVGVYTGNVKPGETTDDTQPTISGTGTAGDTIIVYVKDSTGNHEIGRTTVNSEGKWTLRPASPLVKGTNEFTAVEVDPVGNSTDPSASYTVNIDFSKPQPPVIETVEDNVGTITAPLQKGDVTDDNTPTLKGTAVPNGIVTIYNNDVKIGTARVDKDGNWSFTPESALADGKYNITADATNTVGQTSEKTGIFDFTVDTTPPGAVENLLISDNVGAYQGALKDSDTTDDNTPTFSGKAEAGGIVSVYSDGNLLGTAKVAADGSWSFTPSTPLPDGSYKFTTTVTDKAGNTGAATPVVNITINTESVTVSLDTLVDNVGDIVGKVTPNGVTDDTRPEITGTGKAGSIIKVYDGATLLGSTTVNADKSWSFTPTTDLGQGKHSITATATDLSGNTSDPTSAFEFTVDTVAPAQPTIESAKDDVGSIQNDLLNGAATDDPTPTLTGKAEKGSIVKVYDGDALLGSVVADATTGQWTFTPTSPLQEGVHKFHVTSTDAAGNVSLPSSDFVLIMDFTGPDSSKLSITGVDDQVGAMTGNVKDGEFTDDTRPTIQGTGTSGDKVYVYVSHDSGANVLIGTAIVKDNGTWSLRPEDALKEGSNKFTAYERDPVGNEAGPSNAYTITVDGTPVVVPTLDKVIDDVGIVTGNLKSGDVTDDTKPVFEGTASAGCTIRIYDGATLLGSTMTDASGKWTFEPSTALKDGTHNITFTATSPIGQVSDPSSVFVLEVDTKVPSPVESLLITDNVGGYQGPLSNGDTTDDSTPTFSGKAEAGSVVTIYNNGVAIGSAAVSEGGTWSFTPSTDLPDGNYKFTTTVTDKAGNIGDPTAVVNITIDTSTLSADISKLIDDTGTVTGDIQANGITDDLRPEIVGTSSKPGSIITVYIDGVNQGTATVKADGSWSFTPTTDLGQGDHKVTITAKDAAGNVTPMSPEFAFTIDSIPPSVPTIEKAVDNVGTITGDLKTGDSTDDNTPTLYGNAEKGSIITIYDENDKPLGSVVVNDQGKWVYELPVQADGRHDYYVIASDAAGNKSNPTSDFTLTIDTQGPMGGELKIDKIIDNVGIITGDLASGGKTDDSRPELKGVGHEIGNTIIIYAEDELGVKRQVGSTTVGANNVWSHELILSSALADGTYKFTVVEVDAVGNATAPSNEFIVTVDTSVSDAKITITGISEDSGSVNSDFITNDNTLLINGTLDKTLLADEWVEITLDGGNTWTRAASVTGTNWTVDLQGTVLPDGNYTIQARVVDDVGNIGNKASHDMTVVTVGRDMEGLNTTMKLSTDTSNGLVSGQLFSQSATLTNDDMVTRDRNVTLSGTLSAALKSGEYLQISLDNGSTWHNVAMAGNTWSYELPEVSANTTYNIKLQAIDNVGNVGINTGFTNDYKVTIDLTIPDSIREAPDVAEVVNSKDSFTFDSSRYGAVEAGAIVSLISDVNSNGTYQEGLDQVLGFAKANADGTWSLNTTLPAGAHNLAFMVWDNAGNHSSLSKTTSVGVTDGAGSLLVEQSWGGTVNPGLGLNSAAVTISQNGSWSFFQAAAGTSGATTANAGRVYTATTRENYESTYLAQPSNVTDASYERYINSAVFADINRDGYSDVMSQVSSYGNGGLTAYWMQNADGSYTARSVNQGSLNHLGGLVAYDRHGDGYLDFVLADSEADSISFLKNEGGALSYEYVAGFYNGHPGGALPINLSVMHEVGAVDIDNNGTIDITAHINYNGAGVGVGNLSRGLGILYNQTTGTSKTNFGSVGYYANVFRDDGHQDAGNLSISMTYADYNGDGWLDLFLSRGSKNSVNSNENRIYLNDGTGKLKTADAQALWFGDSIDGGTSLAVDWNHDGKIDIIEVPRSGVNGSPMLYTNNGTGTWGANSVSLTGTKTFSNLTGAVALDYDWDGSMDLVLYRGGSLSNVVSSASAAPTLLVKNTNIAADGSSLQVRIVDGFGINTFYSNTVKLYNSAGELVATQLINPQASGSSNSMGLVSFFGLDPNEVYSVQLLRITNGVENHVGATSSIGGYTNGTVNATWGGLTTNKSHDSYVLTAENTDAVNDTVGAGGIIGTGYNDTFFSSAGNDTYSGSGGWDLIVSGKAVWSETGGLDIVDYRHATSAVTANLRTGAATGHGTDTLVSIEGLVGTAYGDTFTDNAANNHFEGGGGDDTFYLTNGGNDRLVYRVHAGKEGDGTGGTGKDTIYSFKVGNLLTDKNADLIDLSDLLNYSGPLSCFVDGGKMTLDYASLGILDYLKVEQVGSDTVISIDRDGKGGAYGFQQLITLKGVNIDLETLLANNQIEVGDDSLTTKSSTTKSLLSITQMFTEGHDIMFGTGQEDILLGGLGDDTFIGMGKGDQVKGGDGNDIIKVISTDFSSISGDAGIDTLVLDTKGDLFDLSALKDKLSSVEIFDMGHGSNTLNVSLEDVLRLGSEELAINGGNKAIVVNGDAGSTLQLNSADGQWTMSQSNYQYQGNTYNVWTMGTSGVEVLVENTVNPVIL